MNLNIVRSKSAGDERFALEILDILLHFVVGRTRVLVQGPSQNPTHSYKGAKNVVTLHSIVRSFFVEVILDQDVGVDAWYFHV